MVFFKNFLFKNIFYSLKAGLSSLLFIRRNLSLFADGILNDIGITLLQERLLDHFVFNLWNKSPF